MHRCELKGPHPGIETAQVSHSEYFWSNNFTGIFLLIRDLLYEYRLSKKRGLFAIFLG